MQIFILWIARFGLFLATACLVGIAALVTLSALTRYVASAPFAFTEELVGLLLCSMLFLSLPYALLEGKLIRIDLLTSRLHGFWSILASVFGLAVLLGFLIVFIIESYKSFLFTFRLNIRSEVAELLLYPWTALIPLCMILVLLSAFISENIWRRKPLRPSVPKRASQESES